MLDKINSIKSTFDEDISKVNSLEELESIRIKYLGRKGSISELFEEFKTLSKEEKPKYGQTLNQLKNDCQNKFDSVFQKYDESKKRF